MRDEEDDVGEHRRGDEPAVRHRATPLAALGVGIALILALAAGAGLAVAAPGDLDADDAGEALPCATAIQACVRLSTQEVWITDGQGKLLRGPIHMNHGADEAPTPTGTFHVQRKSEHHVSQEQQGRKMPYAVFFDGEGRAFHEGDPERQSVGCIRMERDDARFVFQNLDIGDAVQIVE